MQTSATKNRPSHGSRRPESQPAGTNPATPCSRSWRTSEQNYPGPARALSPTTTPRPDGSRHNPEPGIIGLVGGGRDGGVGEEPQDVGFAVLQAFQQEQAWRLPDLAAAGDAADLGQAGVDAVAEKPQEQIGRGVFRGRGDDT